MPRGDRTGPAGLGPMTGRGMGYCAGYDAPGCANPCFGRGFGRSSGRGAGRGFGGGRAFGRMAWTTPEQMAENGKVAEKNLLKELKAERDEIEKAIKDIEQKTKQKK